VTNDRQDQPSSRAVRPAPAPLAPNDPFEPVIEAVAGGQLRRSQDVVAAGVLQAVDLIRPDGSFWRAYERLVVLPPHDADAARVMREATAILTLAAAAVMATETARSARRATTSLEAPPWRCTYGPLGG